MKSRLTAKFIQLVAGYVKHFMFAALALVFAGCGTSSTAPPKSVVIDPNGNFHLYISNQSFAISPVDIRVFIDGELVTKGLFDVGSQHTVRTFVLELQPGQHKIVAKSSKGRAKLEQTFEVGDKLWASLAYWYYPKPEGGVRPSPRHFSFDVKDEPIYFF
jgi:hypothetical protein